MNKRTALETSVKAALNASKANDVKHALGTFSNTVSGRYQGGEPSIDQRFEIVRSRRQIMKAAVGELACREVTYAMAIHWERWGDLLIKAPPSPDALAQYSSASSPGLHRFLTGLYDWFTPAYGKVFHQAAAGRMPHAAIVDAGTDELATYNPVHQEWITYSSQPLARLRRQLRTEGKLPQHHTFEKSNLAAIQTNIPIVAALLTGRAVAHHISGSTVPLIPYIKSQLPALADASSLVATMSAPLLNDSMAYLNTCAQWAEGDLPLEDFIQKVATHPLSTTESCLHPTLATGRIARAGHCGADVPFMEPDAFPYPPSGLLRTLGTEPPTNPSMTHLFLNSGNAIAPETLFNNWPRNVS